MLALGSPVVRLSVLTRQNMASYTAKCPVFAPFWSHFRPFSRPDQYFQPGEIMGTLYIWCVHVTRKEDWLVQTVSCIVDTRWCHSWQKRSRWWHWQHFLRNQFKISSVSKSKIKKQSEWWWRQYFLLSSVLSNSGSGRFSGAQLF